MPDPTTTMLPNHRSSLSATAVLALLATLLPAQGQTAARAAEKIGDLVPEFTFPEFWNGDGRQSLSEFRGSPILIDFWGTH